MTLEEACRLIDPATDLDALAEVEYYNGFKGKEAAAKTLREASQMVVDFIRRVSWHDAKTPPIQRTDAKGQTYTVPGLCKIGADHIICGLPVYLPTAKCDKIIEAPPKDGS